MKGILSHRSAFRLGSILACLGFLAAVFSSCANPAGGDPEAGIVGDGSESNPYRIRTAADLNAVRGGVEGYEDWDLADHYKLLADIDLSGYAAGEGWVPLGDNATSFTGSLDGNGHTISNLTIKRSAHYQGLFGYCNGGTIKNLALEDVSIAISNYNYAGALAGSHRSFYEDSEIRGIISGCRASGEVSGSSYVGVLVGWQGWGSISECRSEGRARGDGFAGGIAGRTDYGSIADSYSTAVVAASSGERVGGLIGELAGGTVTGCYATGQVTGYAYVGGLVGYQNYESDIIRSHATGSVSGSSGTGGLVGYQDYNSDISRSYATGSVSGSSGTGGLVGTKKSGTIANCFAMGSATGTSSNVGGLLGSQEAGTITNCYSTGLVTGSSATGGGVGTSAAAATVTSCFYDTETSGKTDDDYCTGRTTAQMKTASTYAAWPADIWNIHDGSYPALK